MSGRLGLECTPSVIRGVVASPWRGAPARTFAVSWDPDDPVTAVRALRNEVSRPDAVWLAVGLGFLHLARVQLPPAGDPAREHMVQLEPQRFFATEEALRASLTPGGDVAYGVDADWLDRLLASLSTWATVVRVDPAPMALAAALPPTTSGLVALDAAPGELGLAELKDGSVVAVRRAPHGTVVGAQVSVAASGPVPASHLVALGALRLDGAPLTGSLLTGAQRRTEQRRGMRQLVTAVVAAAAGLLFVFAAADRARERTLGALRAEAERLAISAAPALDAQARLLGVEREGLMVRATLASRSNPSSALAALSEVLPRDVVIVSAKATGAEWQLDGTARNAAALVPLLDADSRFDNVRSLAASARFRDGNMTRESFSLSLHVRPSP